jgi:hypothetical protein
MGTSWDYDMTDKRALGILLALTTCGLSACADDGADSIEESSIDQGTDGADAGPQADIRADAGSDPEPDAGDTAAEPSSWGITITTSTSCEPAEACWRSVNVGSDGQVAINDNEGALQITDVISAEDFAVWEALIPRVTTENCYRSGQLPADFVEQVHITLVDTSRPDGEQNHSILRAWDCFGRYGEDNIPELPVAYRAALAHVHDVYDCDPWVFEDRSFGPWLATEDTPRYLCAP